MLYFVCKYLSLSCPSCAAFLSCEKIFSKLVEGAGGLGVWGWVVYIGAILSSGVVIISGTMKVLSVVHTGVIPRSLISWSFP